MSRENRLWNSNSDVAIVETNNVDEIVSFAPQLSTRDKKQIVSAFTSSNFQMLATYVWTKTITSIKSQLMKMGAAFIGEMLDRPDINEYSNLVQVITDSESLQLAEDLGLINSKSAFRLRQSMELLNNYNNPELEEEDVDDFDQADATTVLKTCIKSVLGHESIEFRMDFKNFRDSLENRTLSFNDDNIQKLNQGPYFFKRATVRILLSIIKSKTGAQLENSLANSNTIIPLIWNDIKQPEKWQVGRCYAELFTDGQSKAASGLKSVLLKVRGFDFVPEDLRSNSFIKVAHDIIAAHEGINNFYNEPAPTRTLLSMGSVIPTPALPVCMSAVLSVYLGNAWGVSWDAEVPAKKILDNITLDRWQYYFDECLLNDKRILSKITGSYKIERWVELISKVSRIETILDNLQLRDAKNLLKATLERNNPSIARCALKMVESEY